MRILFFTVNILLLAYLSVTVILCFAWGVQTLPFSFLVIAAYLLGATRLAYTSMNQTQIKATMAGHGFVSAGVLIYYCTLLGQDVSFTIGNVLWYGILLAAYGMLWYAAIPAAEDKGNRTLPTASSNQTTPGRYDY
jgi:hypothetical protein